MSDFYQLNPRPLSSSVSFQNVKYKHFLSIRTDVSTVNNQQEEKNIKVERSKVGHTEEKEARKVEHKEEMIQGDSELIKDGSKNTRYK